jgi:hypothetical protein
MPRARILYNFGREETVDRAALVRLAHVFGADEPVEARGCCGDR